MREVRSQADGANRPGEDDLAREHPGGPSKGAGLTRINLSVCVRGMMSVVLWRNT